MTSPPDRIAFLGNYPPRLCGIATFTQDICESVSAAAPQSLCYAGAVNDGIERYNYPSRVQFELTEADVNTYRRAADFLNFENADVLCLQHEFGIYGGVAGSHILALLKEVRMPVVTTLHTLLCEPSGRQRKVMEELVERSDRLVVMARKGAEILRDIYAAPDEKIDIIPHGIPDIPFLDSNRSKEQFGVAGRTVLLTFGLLGPGKGIEYAIEALPEITRAHPEVVYLVLGATHPQLLAREGEQYRLSLERLAEERGVQDHVIFYNRYVSLEDLTEFICATDIYLTPYLDEAQITSGTLAYVFGAGKPVVSTPYWHAQELLAENRGTLVPFRDGPAIAAAVRRYLEDPGLMDRTRQEAYRQGRNMVWPAVASRFLESFQHAREDRQARPRAAFAGWTLGRRPFELPPLRLGHIARMSDQTGIFQHALFNVPDFSHGYCIDDNARAYLLCCLLDDLIGGNPADSLGGLATTYLAFVAAALNPDTGRFRNFMGYGRQWLEEEGSEDSHGRALWALGTGAARSRNGGRKLLCINLFERGMEATRSFESPRAWAFTLLGVQEYLEAVPGHTGAVGLRDTLLERLMKRWRVCATDDWPWFERSLTYENARLCQALLVCGRSAQNPESVEVGLRALRWLASLQTTQEGNFRPIGSNGFYPCGGARADFDQQPVEAQAMVSAALEAHRITNDAMWRREARRAFEWFLGRNDIGLPLYDAGSGGCFDGLHADSINENQGAESTLAFHLALAEMNHAAHPLTASP